MMWSRNPMDGSTLPITLTQSGAAQELDYSAVFRVKDGKVELLDKEVQPNGIAFTADEKTLYVGGGKIWKYDVKPDAR